jgi:hypothetical protein
LSSHCTRFLQKSRNATKECRNERETGRSSKKGTGGRCECSSESKRQTEEGKISGKSGGRQHGFTGRKFQQLGPACHHSGLSAGGHYSTTVALPPGRHEYKFVVNGEWQIDEKCPQWVPNASGTLNSVVEVV